MELETVKNDRSGSDGLGCPAFAEMTALRLPMLGEMTVASDWAINNHFAVERAMATVTEWIAMQSVKVESWLLVPMGVVGKSLRTARQMPAELAYRVKRGHWRLQEALREKENNLARIVADSPDPMLVTDDLHRVLAANSAALDLLGVSKMNLSKFTIDAFLPYGQIHCFERTGPPFVKGAERLGECVIRRLDGRVRTVEFTFQANFVSGRHLSRFREVSVPQ